MFPLGLFCLYFCVGKHQRNAYIQTTEFQILKSVNKFKLNFISSNHRNNKRHTAYTYHHQIIRNGLPESNKELIC